VKLFDFVFIRIHLKTACDYLPVFGQRECGIETSKFQLASLRSLKFLYIIHTGFSSSQSQLRRTSAFVSRACCEIIRKGHDVYFVCEMKSL